MQILRTTGHTWAKAEPQQRSELSRDRVVHLEPGRELAIVTWRDATAEHLEIETLHPLGDRCHWFVYGPHVEISEPMPNGDDPPTVVELPVYPQEEEATPLTVAFNTDSTLKRSTAQSGTLSAGDRVRVAAGQAFAICDFERVGDPTTGDHVRFTIADPNAYPGGNYAVWYGFEQHLTIYQGEEPLLPPRSPAQLIPKDQQHTGPTVTLPTGTTVYLAQPILPGGSFNWGEATHGGQRIPQTTAHEHSIISLAQYLQRARNQIGQPFRVTSWYRPDPWNRRVGGARYSQHKTGKAADIVVQGWSGADLARAFYPWWPGGIGIYGGNRRHIIHLDIGPKRKWGF